MAPQKKKKTVAPPRKKKPVTEPKKTTEPTIFDETLHHEDILPEEHEFLDEPEEHEETPEELEIKMHIGGKETDVYTEEGLEEEVEEDEISPWEEGFMEGELHGGTRATCYHCGAILDTTAKHTFEKEVDDTVRLFCSQKCLDECDEDHE